MKFLCLPKIVIISRPLLPLPPSSTHPAWATPPRVLEAELQPLLGSASSVSQHIERCTRALSACWGQSQMAEGPLCSPHSCCRPWLWPQCEPRMSSVLLGCTSLLPPHCSWTGCSWLAAICAGSPFFCSCITTAGSKHLSKTFGGSCE